LPLPQVSVVIPTYKRPELLHRALASIGSHDWQETIVIDDDPEMSGMLIVKDFPGVRYFCKRGFDRGLANSRNISISLVRGRYVCFLDDDDYFQPGGLEQLYRATKSCRAFYYGNFRFVRKNLIETRNLADAHERQLLIVNEIPVGSYLIEKVSIRHLFDGLMKSHEDWDFLLKNVDWSSAEYVSNEIVNIDKTREDESSMSVRRRKHFWMEFVGIYSKFPAPQFNEYRVKFLEGLGVHIPRNLIAETKSF
jgi:glycosyltransferase involved in cell wall biosynthesis